MTVSRGPRSQTKDSARVPESKQPSWQRRARIAVLLFAAALTIRLLFVTATPDSAWAYTVAFKGDAPLWLDYAAALHLGEPFELGLPLHPPGNAYLLAGLWNGDPSGIPVLRLLWCVAGALTVVAFWAAAARSFGETAGLVAGVLLACSTGLIVVSGSLCGEAPYLLLVGASFVPLNDLRARPRPILVMAWAGANALACLFRVEHALAFLLIWVWLWLGWPRDSRRERIWLLAAATTGFLLPLVPWHVHAWRAIARFNTEPPSPGPAEAAALRAVEGRVGDVSWEESAARQRDGLPAFARRTAAGFVAATVRHRGRSRIGEGDLQILKDAFGSVPAPVACCPFVSSYGPLNFALANHPAASGGFSRAALDQAPPLFLSQERYPPELVRGLPPPDLTLTYPPHLRLVNEGYRLGWAWIAERPGRFLRLASRKLRLFWSGAAMGFTGDNVPLGLAGLRRAVDMVTPDDDWKPAVWQLGVLAVSLLGILVAFPRSALTPWLLFLASKVAITVLFFGYARQGACVIPVVALLAALLAEKGTLRSRRLAGSLPKLALAMLFLSLTLETVRWVRSPTPFVDGQRIQAVDPFRDLHRDQRVRWVHGLPSSGSSAGVPSERESK